MREMLRFVALSRKFYMVLMISKHYEPGLPVVAFRFSEAYRTKYPDIKQKWIQTLLRSKGWIVPNYELAPDLSEIEILRVVVRETVSEVLIERLLGDLVSLPVTAPAPPDSPPGLQIDITESLAKDDTPTHALSILSHNTHGERHEVHHGKLDANSAQESSGTYAKQC